MKDIWRKGRLAHRNRFKVMFSGLMGLLVYVFYIAYLSYSGHCISEVRHLSDQEKIRYVVYDILRKYPPPGRSMDALFKNNTWQWKSAEMREKLPPPQYILPLKHPVPYRDINEFFMLNPACCEVMAARDPEGEPPSFLERLTGNVSSFVKVKYLVRFRDDRGVEHSLHYEISPAITNCGRPLERR